MSAESYVCGKATSLFKRLIATSAVALLDSLNSRELYNLEAYYVDQCVMERAGIVDICVERGILSRDRFPHDEFTSPVMWRYFVQKRLSLVPRAMSAAFSSLPDLPSCLLRDLNYGLIRDPHRTHLPVSRFAKRSWRIQLYKAVYRLTPASFETSIDSDELFGPPGFIDLVIRIKLHSRYR